MVMPKEIGVFEGILWKEHEENALYIKKVKLNKIIQLFMSAYLPSAVMEWRPQLLCVKESKRR